MGDRLLAPLPGRRGEHPSHRVPSLTAGGRVATPRRSPLGGVSLAGLLLWLAAVLAGASTPTPAQAPLLVLSPSAMRDLGPDLAPLCAKHGVPALSAAVARSDALLAAGVAGVRKYGIAEPVTLLDRFHLGSCTKSMTASLGAVLVEAGKLRWDLTVAEAFPELAEGMDPAWRAVTLDQLLRHRGGAPSHRWLEREGIWSTLWNHPGTPVEQRQTLVQEVTRRAPETAPGGVYEYSNAGYSIAGRMMERAAGVPWEQLISERLFRPLGMASAGFGVPATPRYVDEPWGHRWKDGVPHPVEPGRDADNPPAIGPGGTVHAGILDFARYAAWHLAGARSAAPLLGRDAFQRLHTVDGATTGYAMGWEVTTRPWAGGIALTHNGSNTQWFAVIWVAPARDLAIVAATNVGGDRGFAAVDAVASAMAARFAGLPATATADPPAQ